MRNKLVLIISFLALLWSLGLASNAEIRVDEEGNYVNTDKFVSERGRKVKFSRLAEMMENGTKKAMQGDDYEEEDEYAASRFAKKESELEKYKKQNQDRQYFMMGGYRLF